MSNEVYKVKGFHSFVSVITNSSTVIYTYVDSVQAVKDFINAVLSAIPNLTVDADDLFEFKIVMSNGAAERLVDRILDDEDDTDKHYIALKEIYEKVYPSWTHKTTALNTYVKDNLPLDEAVVDSGWDYYEPETDLLLVRKDGTDIPDDLGAMLKRVFYHTATHDG